MLEKMQGKQKEFEVTEASALFDGAAYAEMEALLQRAQRSIRLTF